MYPSKPLLLCMPRRIVDVASDVARAKLSSEANMRCHIRALACALQRSGEQGDTRVGQARRRRLDTKSRPLDKRSHGEKQT